jgi:hypothetical protein
MNTWTCAECEARNPATPDARFCRACGTPRVTALAAPAAPFLPPWERPGWTPSTSQDACDADGCTKTVREHIDEALEITSRPGTLFTRVRR